MTFGDVYVQMSVPPLPAGTGLSQQKYTDLVKAAVNDLLTQNGMVGIRTTWIGRSDVPTDPAYNASYVMGLLDETDIDTSKVSLAAGPTSATEYCIVSTSEVYCYGGLTPTWTGSPASNPFVASVPLPNDNEVNVAIEFVVRWLQALESPPNVTLVTGGQGSSTSATS